MMKTNHLPKADVLDIIFEHRNKSYGAYVLRREYPRQLARGLAATFLLAAMASALLLTGNDHPVVQSRWTGEPSVVTLSDIFAPPPPAVLPPEPPPSSVRPTVQDLVPEIVPDDVAVSIHVPTIDERMSADLGSHSETGTGNVSIAAQPSPRPAGSPVAETPSPAEPEVFDFRSVEVPAEFPGGHKALLRFLERNLQNPAEGLADGERKKVQVRFVVGATGHPGSFELLQSGGESCDREVLRVLGRMPRWTPARQNGRDVPMYFILPVVFAWTEPE